MSVEWVYPKFTKVDRTGWPNGEWDSEPDRIEWRMHGYYCLVNRNPIDGRLCGYVALEKGHKYCGIRSNKLSDILDTEVHGGITWASQAKDFTGTWQFPIWDMWIVGFDCGHGGIDFMPSISNGFNDEKYRNAGYVVQNVHILLHELMDKSRDISVPYHTVTLIDDERVEIAPQRIVVGGDGYWLWRDAIRYGMFGVALDWLEEYPEYLTIGAGMFGVPLCLTSEHHAMLIGGLRDSYSI